MRHNIPFLARPFSWQVLLSTVLLAGLLAATTNKLPAQQDQFGTPNLGMQRGVCVLLGMPGRGRAKFLRDAAQRGDLTIYFQSPDAAEVSAARKAAESAGLLGSQIFVDQGAFDRIHLADNLAGAVLVSAAAEQAVGEDELLRVLHPRGRAILQGREIVKPFPKGTDWWTHPYHAPDNNPQSTDQLAKAPYLTQFLADPKFCPMPEVSVAAGGRVYRAFGHIAHKANQNAMLNTLICVNAYNGTILWKRKLTEGFVIHRNTMIATAEELYLADHESCKVIDGATGKLRDEIIIQEGQAEGKVWKWMALVDGILYAMIGGDEIRVATKPSRTRGLGHWPWGMWEGHDYSDPKSNIGFGRTMLALRPSDKKILWTHRSDQFLDSRGTCMASGRIYTYSPGKELRCLDAKTGQVVWSNADAKLLESIGSNTRAQKPIEGYATTTYIKCNDEYLFFAGPQRPRMVVVRTKDGSVAWQKEHGNYQLVLRDDGIYAAGPQIRTPQIQQSGVKLAYDTGKVLAQLPMRRACTRATGSVDSVFYRASGGTVRIDTASGDANHIAPMRPPCQDGVIISDGNLYWGPWMCGCQLSLYGHICLTSGSQFDYQPGLDDSRLQTFSGSDALQSVDARPGDWPTYQGDNTRSATADVDIAEGLTRRWSFDLASGGFPTAPVTAGRLVFFGDRNGVLRALRAEDGTLQWEAYTGGAITAPPAVAGDRIFVGSADGRVYAMEAATGRPLWTFRAAPADRWIPVYGKLHSTWPVSGGVVVQDGVVYAAAGIAHYDGTHVYALDAASGQVKWYNDSSGTISELAKHGVSLQGELVIRNGELRFLAGGVHEEARYDLATGKCLNEPNHAPRSMFHTASYAFFPEYGKYTALDCILADGQTLCYDITYEGSWHDRLKLLPAGARRPAMPISRWGVQRRSAGNVQSVWQLPPDRKYAGFIVTKRALLAAGVSGMNESPTPFLSLINVADGSELWKAELPDATVRGGAAVNHQGNVFVALEKGQVLAFAASE